MDSTDPSFWETRYLAGRTPWDFRGVPPGLVDFLQRANGTGTVLIPGCGTGYEVKAFHGAGWRPLAIDFSPTAVRQAREALGSLASFVRQADFFGEDVGGPFDLIYERTFLCSLPPERWPSYVARMVQLLRPGGLLAGLFYYGSDPEGPPFPMAASQARSLLSPFELRTDRPVPAEQSLTLFAGHERWQEWQLKSR